MPTVVCFHAHPDDESIATAGLMARASAAGHRVVLVVATRGERGTPVPGVLADGEDLSLRRTAETYESARRVGAQRVEFLGFVDSDMMGEPANEEPWTFWQADVDHAARRLSVILDEERADLLTVYDDNGGYGHPDHIQVHRVGTRAASMAGTPVVFESTMNRTFIQRRMEEMPVPVESTGGDTAAPSGPPDVSNLGKPEEEITHRVDVRAVLDRKRAAMEAHESQIAPDHFLLAMAPEVFAEAMGTEWFILHAGDVSAGSWVAELFEPHQPGA
ncbi:MAG: PIG-L family deacetylase [Actinobacteria bacterium]|nr:PIG-L family deacetylase [Actinomycetota bacterium]